MLIFWNAGLVFLANPKTGSEALQEALWPHADIGTRFPPFYRHMTLAWFQQRWAKMLTADELAQLETFALVREPVDWLSSWYRYRLRDDIAGHPNSTRGLSFAAFVEAWLREAPPPFASVGRQSRFCAPRKGATGIDHLFAYEAHDVARGFLEDRLGHRLQPERRNVSPAAATDLPRALRARLERDAAAEFELHARARRAS